MKILGIVRSYDSPDDVKSFYDVQAFYLQKELRSRDIEFNTMLPPADPDRFFMEEFNPENGDHLLGFRLRYFDSQLSPDTVKKLRHRIRGAVAQFADSPRKSSTAHLNFVAKDRTDGPFKPYCVVGWAADHEACQSRQSRGGVLRILMDHRDYDPKRKDITDQILVEIDRLKHSNIWRKAGYDSIEVDALTTPKTSIGVYGAPSVAFEEICKKYWRAHIFIVTHQESVGLSVIEAATSGALIVVPRGFIDEGLLSTVRRIAFSHDDPIPWGQIMTKIDPRASRRRASTQTWGNVADRIIAGLREFESCHG